MDPFPDSAYDRSYYNRFFRYWSGRWPSEASFVFVRFHRDHWRLILPEDVDLEDALTRLESPAPPSPTKRRMPPDDNMAWHLRCARRRLRLTLKQVEELSGVAYRYLSALEKGTRPLSPKLHARLADFYRKASEGKIELPASCTKPDTKIWHPLSSPSIYVRSFAPDRYIRSRILRRGT